jgi:hypothetical protein
VRKAVGPYKGMQGRVGSETQGGPLAPCRHHLANHLLCILSMVAWLSNG